MATDQQIEFLLSLMGKSTPGELSVLKAALRKSPDDEVAMGAFPGSGNDALWSAMVPLGWMSVKEDVIKTTPVPIPVRLFYLTAAGRGAVADLLERFGSRAEAQRP